MCAEMISVTFKPNQKIVPAQCYGECTEILFHHKIKAVWTAESPHGKQSSESLSHCLENNRGEINFGCGGMRDQYCSNIA